jgi:hypothetical protein
MPRPLSYRSGAVPDQVSRVAAASLPPASHLGRHDGYPAIISDLEDAVQHLDTTVADLIRHYESHMRLAKIADSQSIAEAHYRLAGRSWFMAETLIGRHL